MDTRRKVWLEVVAVLVVVFPAPVCAAGAKLIWTGGNNPYRVEAVMVSDPTTAMSFDVGNPTADVNGHRQANVSGLTGGRWEFRVVQIQSNGTELRSNAIVIDTPPTTTTTTMQKTVPLNLDSNCDGILNARDVMISLQAVTNPGLRSACP